MTKVHTTIRFSEETARELAELTTRTGETQTAMISRALHDLHRATFAANTFYLCCQCGQYIPAPDWPGHKAQCASAVLSAGNGKGNP